jgi:hypothetical protein
MVQSESQAGHMGRMESLQQPFPRAPVWVKPGSQGRGGGGVSRADHSGVADGAKRTRRASAKVVGVGWGGLIELGQNDL